MTSVDDLSLNLRQILGLLERLPPDVRLVCFPENALFLKLARDQKIPPLKLSDSVFAALQKVAEQKQIHIMLGSAPIAVSEFQDPSQTAGPAQASNATVYLRPGAPAKAVYRKIHLFDVDVSGAPAVRESDSFVHGSDGHVLEIEGWRFGLSICYDVRFAELYSRYARQNVHALLVPSAFLVPTGKAHWHILLRARAIENQCYVLAAAQAGRHLGKTGETRQTYGHSLAVDPWGEVLADLGETGPGIKVVTLLPERLAWVQNQIPQSQHRRLV